VYIVPPAVVLEVPAAYPNELEVKLAAVPDVEAAESPDADALGVVPDVTTDATIDTPVAGDALDTL
jgi:hypothetical protein